MAKRPSIHTNFICITPEAERKRQAYIDRCDLEISGLGVVEVVDNTILITDVFLLKQEVSAGGTILDKKAIHKLTNKCLMKGISPLKLKYWWHSHVEMGVGWSKIDKDTMEKTFQPQDYFVSTVGNKKGEQRTRIDLFSPMKATIDGIGLYVVHDDQVEYDKAIEDEIESLVTKMEIIKFGKGAVNQVGYNKYKQKQAEVGDGESSEYTDEDWENYINGNSHFL